MPARGPVHLPLPARWRLEPLHHGWGSSRSQGMDEPAHLSDAARVALALHFPEELGGIGDTSHDPLVQVGGIRVEQPWPPPASLWDRMAIGVANPSDGLAIQAGAAGDLAHRHAVAQQLPHHVPRLPTNHDHLLGTRPVLPRRLPPSASGDFYAIDFGEFSAIGDKPAQAT